jgi:hypothetical protein
MAPSMPTTRPDAARRRRAIPVPAFSALLVPLLVTAACASPTPTPSPSPLVTVTAAPRATPEPTPIFSNVFDPELMALIPTQVVGNAVRIPSITEFSITPGDIGQVYGEIGTRFRSLQLAFVSQPRLSLFAMRMNPPFATTAELEPYLAEAGRYVGIAGLHLESWTLRAIAGHLVWVRPEDNATLKGTRVYTWAVDGLVFLMIGVDEGQNLAMLAALPGEPAPTPVPSAKESPSPQPSATAS